MTEPAKDPQADSQKIHPPVDVVDGLADRQAKPPRWKYILIAAIYVAWIAFLIYCLLAGNG